MKILAVLLVLVGSAYGAGFFTNQLKISPLGEASYRYNEKGTIVAEDGVYKRTPDGKDNVLVKKGSYQYITPDGVTRYVSYTADETGFHPVSSDIPVPVKPLTPTF